MLCWKIHAFETNASQFVFPCSGRFQNSGLVRIIKIYLNSSKIGIDDKIKTDLIITNN